MDIRSYLEPIADWFATFNMPEPIVHWGHPLMMGIVVLAMGSYVGLTGWQGRVTTEPDVAIASHSMHKKLAIWMFTFIALGYTGGVLSMVMQDQPIFESPHFWTGSAAIAILGLNAVLSLTKFGGGQPVLRTAHAYIGSAALCLLFLHAVLGVKLGLAI